MAVSTGRGAAEELQIPEVRADCIAGEVVRVFVLFGPGDGIGKQNVGHTETKADRGLSIFKNPTAAALC